MALNKRKYLLAYQPSAFYAMLAGLFPRVSVPCIVHPANEVTPYTDWALPGEIVASHELNRVHGVGRSRAEGIDIEQGNLIPCLNQLLVEPVPLNTVKLPIRWNIFISVADGDSQCAYWKYYPKHSAVKIFFCLDIGIWHPSLEYACCIFLSFANCSLGTFQFYSFNQ